ncbi:MAG: hypothetical protein ACI8YQ_003023 [Polaribacter sp.]|jgi:hypothetical protein
MKKQFCSNEFAITQTHQGWLLKSHKQKPILKTDFNPTLPGLLAQKTKW